MHSALGNLAALPGTFAKCAPRCLPPHLGKSCFKPFTIHSAALITNILLADDSATTLFLITLNLKHPDKSS